MSDDIIQTQEGTGRCYYHCEHGTDNCGECSFKWLNDSRKNEKKIASLERLLKLAEGAIEDMNNSGEILQEPLMQELLDEIRKAREA